MRGAFRAIFYGEGGSIESRAAAKPRRSWPDVTEVGEIVDFILADAKQPLCLARRRGAIERMTVAGHHRRRRRICPAPSRKARATPAATVFVVALARHAPTKAGWRISP